MPNARTIAEESVSRALETIRPQPRAEAGARFDEPLEPPNRARADSAGPVPSDQLSAPAATAAEVNWQELRQALTLSLQGELEEQFRRNNRQNLLLAVVSFILGIACPLGLKYFLGIG